MTVLDGLAPAQPVPTAPDASMAELPYLLARIADGDAAAFSRLYDLTAERIYGMVFRVLRDPGYSEETTQEVYLAVWRHARDFRPDRGSALSWLITQAHRRAVDRVRSESALTRRTLASGAAELPIRHADEVSDIVAARAARRLVLDSLGDLTDLQRESLILAYYEGLSYRQVSERLSVPLPTVKSRIRDGLKRLRARLDDAA